MNLFLLSLILFIFQTFLNVIKAESETYDSPLEWPEKHLKLKVVTVQTIPFYNVGKEAGKFEGFIPDFLPLLLNSIPNISYELYLEPDNMFGIQLDNGSWNGMIGQLLNKHAHIAVGPLSVISERRRVVKFSIPFMANRIVPVMKKPDFMYFERIMKKPLIVGGRLLFDSIKEMVNMTSNGQIIYGVLKKGQTLSMLKNSKHPFHKQMYRQLENLDSEGHQPYSNSYSEAIDRIRKNYTYTFLMEEVVADFVAQHEPCDLIALSESPLTTTYFSLAFSKDIPETFVDSVNMRIIELQESGHLNMLKNKWWNVAKRCQNTEVCSCDFQPNLPVDVD